MIKKYTFLVSHDKGRTKISVMAQNVISAGSILVESEGCPMSALKYLHLLEAGCYFDSQLGQYQGEEVINFAHDYGMTISADDSHNCYPTGEFYHDLWDEAESYLDDFVPEGYIFGQNDSGDSGVWKVSLCDSCSANVIQGKLCHEHGCPAK